MVSTSNRRTFLKSAAAGMFGALIPFPEWFGRYGAAQATTPLVRYDLTTAQGAAMLADYRMAVAAMTTRPAENPCSWLFQWYTHQTRDDIGKAGVLSAIPAAARALPTEMWDTCQAHYGRGPTYFLPWHRMYVYFFERIVRAASGNPNFTLPYWNYLPTGAARSMPAAFWSSTTDPLYRVDRRTIVNAGQPIDTGEPFAVNADCLDEGDFLPSPGRSGFSAAINGNPHGAVHTGIGSGRGMGTFAWAANDPIFWMHHCNIDRMWASWNSYGHSNPGGTWPDQEFVFADEHCNRVQVKVSDFLATDPVGYRYDRLVPRTNAALIEALRRLRLVAIWPPHIPGPGPVELNGPGPLVLGTRPVTVKLSSAEAGPSLMARSLSGATEIRLALTEMRTNVAPAIFYDVYLGTAAGGNRQARRIQVGAINFFGAELPAEHARMMDPANLPSFTFNVTKAIRALGRDAPLEVSIVPHGEPAARALPVIGKVQLFAG